MARLYTAWIRDQPSPRVSARVANFRIDDSNATERGMKSSLIGSLPGTPPPARPALAARALAPLIHAAPRSNGQRASQLLRARAGAGIRDWKRGDADWLGERCRPGRRAFVLRPRYLGATLARGNDQTSSSSISINSSINIASSSN
jgi:hypothetical protein